MAGNLDKAGRDKVPAFFVGSTLNWAKNTLKQKSHGRSVATFSPGNADFRRAVRLFNSAFAAVDAMASLLAATFGRRRSVLEAAGIFRVELAEEI